MFSCSSLLLSGIAFCLVGFPSSLAIESDAKVGDVYAEITSITTFTGYDEESGMNVLEGSSIDMEIFGYRGSSECKIFGLHHRKTSGEGDFAPGREDEFDGSDIQSCDGKRVHYYPGGISSIRVTHFGEDGWGVRKIDVLHHNIENHDYSYIQCGNDENVFVSDGESVDLSC